MDMEQLIVMSGLIFEKVTLISNLIMVLTFIVTFKFILSYVTSKERRL